MRLIPSNKHDLGQDQQHAFVMTCNNDQTTWVLLTDWNVLQ